MPLPESYILALVIFVHITVGLKVTLTFDLTT